jgi:ATP/maltotriose-dependent transcriptional regulator MalT
MIRQAAEEADPATRRQWLPAVVEIELAAGDVEAARLAADEMTEGMPREAKPLLRAVTALGDGAVRLAEGNPRGALSSLRTAWACWQELEAPYEAARCRVLTARAWRALGDEASASMELDAARAAFLELGAAPDVAAVDALSRRGPSAAVGPLTPREVEIVRLVAAGKSNRAVAGELYLSEKTVERHLSNIFSKLGITSRTAATAYAYEHALV